MLLFGILLYLADGAPMALHAWLTDAYPEASVTGSVFLSAFTTKTAVYVLIRLFPGTEVLLWGGVAMALYGVVYAVLENDIRRLLAYHIISQVGYMVAGVGYFQNPFLALWRIRLATRLKGNPLSLPLRMDYDENHYRLPIGVTVFWIVVFFACISLYNL